jgi:hypothetical protein
MFGGIPILLSEPRLRIDGAFFIPSLDESMPEYLSSPDGSVHIRAHRNADGAPFVYGRPATSREGHSIIELGHPDVLPTDIPILLDTCAATPVIPISLIHLAASVQLGSGQPVLCATGVGSALGRAILDFRFLPPPSGSQFRTIASLRARSHDPAPPTVPSPPSVFALAPAHPQAPAPAPASATSPAKRARSRPTASTPLSDTNDVIARLGIMSNAQLALLVRHPPLGIALSASQPTIDCNHASRTLLAAASSRPIHQLRSNPSVARDDKLECGAVWDGDFSASFPPDRDGNTIICKWFERKHHMPLFTLHPGRSTPDFIDSIDLLHLFVAQLGLKDSHGQPMRIQLLCFDHDPSLAVPGRPSHDRNTAALQTYLKSRPGLSVRPNPPYSPRISKAEAPTRRTNALALRIALHASFNIAETWPIVFDAAAFQFAVQPISVTGPDGALRTTSRFELTTQQEFDRSNILGAPGQIAFIKNQHHNAQAGCPASTGVFYCRPDLHGSAHRVYDYNTGTFRTTRDVHVLPDILYRPILAALSNIIKPAGALSNPSPAAFDSKLRSLMFDYTTISAADLHMTVIALDPLTGLPTSAIRLFPSVDSSGTIYLAEALAPTPAAAPVRPATHGAPLAPPPPHAILRGPKLSPAFAAAFRLLPPDTPIRVLPDQRSPTKPNGEPNPSFARRLAYASATTIRDLGQLTGTLWLDIQFDLARGQILLPPIPPAPVFATFSSAPPPSLVAFLPALPPDLARSPPWLFSHVGSALGDPTLRKFADIEMLEDSPTSPDHFYPPDAIREFLPHAQTPINILASSLLASSTLPELATSFLLPTAAAAFAIDSLPSAPRNMRELEAAPDYMEPRGRAWFDAAKEEMRRAVEWFGITEVTSAHYYELLREFGPDHVALGNLVVAIKLKSKPGAPQPDPDAQRRMRVTIADAKSPTAAHGIDTHSGCADGTSNHVLTQVSVQLRTIRFVIDVQAAYSKAIRPPALRRDPVTGMITGRALFARVAPWVPRYCNINTHDANGLPNLVFIPSAMPGRRESGRCWEITFDAFLLRHGFKQNIYDLRSFILIRKGAFLYILVHVDDTRGSGTHRWIVEEFFLAWKLEFNEPPESTEDTVDEFTGLSHVTVGDEVHVNCTRIIANMADLLKGFDLPASMTCAYPLGSNSLVKLEELPSVSNRLRPDLLELAQKVTGTGAFIVCKVKATAFFAFCTLARYVNALRFTENVWRELLRFAHYLVRSKNRPLIFRRISGDAFLEAWVDSSHQAPGERCGSPGGGLIRLSNGVEHSAPLLVLCSTPRKPQSSTAASELSHIVRITKAITGLRVYMRELERREFIKGPTVLFTDAKVVLDGTHCRRVSREAKSVCASYAIVRQAMADGVVEMRKCDTADNIADIFTKPLTGAQFARAEDNIMGISST